MQTDYRKKAGDHLRAYVKEHRDVFVKTSKKMWENPEFRSRMSQIQRERNAALGTTTHARGYITRTFSKPHQMVEAALIKAGVRGLQREFLIGHYRVDEALPSEKIVIEVDGCYWHGCSICGFEGHPDTLQLDKRKTTYLLKRGWRILRVPEHRVKKDLQKVVQEIVEALYAG